MVLRNILSGPFDDEGGAQECERKNTIIPSDGFFACRFERIRKSISV